MRKIIKVGLGISFFIYFIALVDILILGTSRGKIFTDLSLYEYIKVSSNVIPFKTINTYISAIFDGSMNKDIPIKNLLGNLIIFIPMGIYLPLLINKIKKVSIFSILMIIVLFAIEFIQVVTRKGSFDIDDFILNMLGALVGFGIWNFISKFVINRTQSRIKV